MDTPLSFERGCAFPADMPRAPMPKGRGHTKTGWRERRAILTLRRVRGGRIVEGSPVRGVAIILMVIGALVLAAALFADALGFGAAGSDFGWKQTIGAMLGAGILFGGARSWWETARARPSGTEREG